MNSKIVYYNSTTKEATVEEGRYRSWGYWTLEQLEDYCREIGWTVCVQEEEGEIEDVALFLQPEEPEEGAYNIYERMNAPPQTDWNARDCNVLDDIKRALESLDEEE